MRGIDEKTDIHLQRANGIFQRVAQSIDEVARITIRRNDKGQLRAINSASAELKVT